MNWYRKYLPLKQSQQTIALWLDDERDPSDLNTQRLFGATGSEQWVKTVPDAKTIILNGDVASISFDNDLGAPEEGADLAQWISEQAAMGKIPRMLWYVHTQNIQAAPRIQSHMQNAERFWAHMEQTGQPWMQS